MYLQTFTPVWLFTMRMLSKSAVLCLALLCLSPASMAQMQASKPGLELSKPLVVTFTEFRPYAYTDPSGEVKGYVNDVLIAALKKLQLPYTIESRPTARIYHQLKLGEIDIWAGPVGVPSLQHHVWEVPLAERFSISLYLWRKPNTAAVENLLQLRGQSIAVINGYSYRGLIDRLAEPERQLSLYSSSNHNNALKMLISGRVDYLLDYELPIKQLLPEYPGVTLARHQIQKRRVGFMVSRKGQQSLRLFAALHQAVSEVFQEAGI